MEFEGWSLVIDETLEPLCAAHSGLVTVILDLQQICVSVVSLVTRLTVHSRQVCTVIHTLWWSDWRGAWNTHALCSGHACSTIDKFAWTLCYNGGWLGCYIWLAVPSGWGLGKGL